MALPGAVDLEGSLPDPTYSKLTVIPITCLRLSWLLRLDRVRNGFMGQWLLEPAFL